MRRARGTFLEKRSEKTALAVTGTAGSGKSTALKRLSLDLSNQGLPVLWVDRDSQAAPALIRKRIGEFEDRVVLAMDDADTFGQHLIRLLRDVVPMTSNLLFVFVAQVQDDWSQLREASPWTGRRAISSEKRRCRCS